MQTVLCISATSRRPDASPTSVDSAAPRQDHARVIAARSILVRGAALVILAGCGVVALVVMLDLWDSASFIHGCYDLDNEACMGEWSYRFGAVQAVAAGIGATVIVVGLVARQRVGRTLSWPTYRRLWIG